MRITSKQTTRRYCCMCTRCAIRKLRRFSFVLKEESRSKRSMNSELYSDATTIWEFVWNRQCLSPYLFEQRSFYRLTALYYMVWATAAQELLCQKALYVYMWSWLDDGQITFTPEFICEKDLQFWNRLHKHHVRWWTKERREKWKQEFGNKNIKFRFRISHTRKIIRELIKWCVCDVEMNHTWRKYSRHFEISLQHEIVAVGASFAAMGLLYVTRCIRAHAMRCASAQYTSHYFSANVNRY